ncbi:MAG: hypothetical protein JRJ49_10840 [Deltaproteobacteria bacterium]|nr:hypothetical protein [Deltaproteobacteria bacterium]
MIKPELVIKWGSSKTRRNTLIFYGSLTIIFFVLSVATVSETELEPKAKFKPIVESDPKVKPETPIVSKKIQKIIDSNQIVSETTNNSKKIFYNLYLSHNDFLSLSKADAKELLQSIYNISNKDDYKIGRIAIFIKGTSERPGMLIWNNKEIDITIVSWTGEQCGLKIALENQDLMKSVVEHFFYEIEKLARGFLDDYSNGYDITKYQERVKNIIDTEWENNKFYSKIEVPCFPVFLNPYDKIEIKMMSLLDSIDDTSITNKITTFHIDLIKKDYDELINIAAEAGL